MVKLTLNINHFKNMIFLSLKYLLDIDRTLDLLRNLLIYLKDSKKNIQRHYEHGNEQFANFFFILRVAHL